MFTMENGTQLQKKILQQLQISAGDVLDKTLMLHVKIMICSLNCLAQEKTPHEHYAHSLNIFNFIG